MNHVRNQTAYALKVLRAAINGELPVAFKGSAGADPWWPAGGCFPSWRLGPHYTLTAFNDSGCYDYTECLVEHFEDGTSDTLWQERSASEDIVDLLTPEERVKLAYLLSYDGDIGEWQPDVAGVQIGGAQ